MRDYAIFAREFEACNIDPAEFSHLDHIGVAWELLGKMDFLQALLVYVTSIRTLAEKAGVPEKFNITITIAFLSLIAERRKHSAAGTFEVFMTDNQDLLDRDVLDAWYSTDRLTKQAAREVFLMPDVIQVSA